MRWGAFARLLQAVPVSMLLLDSRGRIQFANQRFMEVAGETLTVFNECFYTFFPTEQKACEAEELVSSVMAQRDYRTLECPLRIGRVKLWAKLSFRPIRFGSERQVLVVLEDLTSQMNELALNMKYKRLVRNFPIGIVELSLNHPISSQMSNETLTNKIMDAKITEGNIEFARSHGYRNERELSGVPLGSVMPWGAQVRKLINRWVENGLSLASVESKERDSKDEVRIFETSLLGLVENGWVTRFWGMRQDITERKRTEEELIEKIKTIDSLYEHILQSGKSRVIADHTAGVAHELRQPLAIIGGLAGRLSKRLKASGLTEDPDTLESLEMMVGEVKRLEKILDGLIDFTRKETIKKQLVDPNELIKYVLRINSDNLREKGLRLESGLDEGIGSAALDPDRFQHVIRNLIANAIDASPVGGVISVSTRVSRLSAKVRKTGDLSSERVFEMKVHNHGSPIPPDELEAIFDPFCTTKDRGAGIGLTLSKKIAEEHDGSISVTSDEKGTQFTVWIPMD
jgi:signal transduction histidine kinase